MDTDFHVRSVCTAKTEVRHTVLANRYAMLLQLADQRKTSSSFRNLAGGSVDALTSTMSNRITLLESTPFTKAARSNSGSIASGHRRAANLTDFSNQQSTNQLDVSPYWGIQEPSGMLMADRTVNRTSQGRECSVFSL